MYSGCFYAKGKKEDMNNAILSCRKLNKRLGNTVAVDKISYEFESSHFYAIKGHHGAGKSTFLQILGLLEDSDNGSVYIDGKDVSKLSDKKKAKYRQKYFGYIFGKPLLNEKFTVLENLMLPMLLTRSKSEAMESAEELLKIIKLHDKKDCYPSELVKGERQQVAVMRAFVNSPECIIADNPTSGLNSREEKIIFEILKDYATQSGKCVICVTESKEVEKYANSVLIYEKGGLYK